MNSSAAMGKLSYQTAIPPMSGVAANSFFSVYFFLGKNLLGLLIASSFFVLHVLRLALISFFNNRMVRRLLALGAFKAGSKVWD